MSSLQQSSRHQRAIAVSLALAASMPWMIDGAAASGCHGMMSFNSGELKVVQGATKKNELCTFTYRMTRISAVTQVVRPANGVVVRKGLGDYVYQPNQNFVGRDTFTLKVNWEANYSATIRYEIAVSP